MREITATILTNRSLSPELWYLELQPPPEWETVQPGQFVQLGLGGDRPELLRRPLSIYQSHPTLGFLYQLVGRGTAVLSGRSPGQQLPVLGPLGRGWQPPASARRALLVAGGVGWAALALLSEQLLAQGVQTDLLVGARNAQTLAALGLDHRPELRLHLATDDGSLGHHGMNTELLPELLDSTVWDYLAACGPEPMLRKVAALAAEQGLDCEVSLEQRMACGLGACLSCVIETTAGRRKVCLDGPVFAAREVWGES